MAASRLAEHRGRRCVSHFKALPCEDCKRVSIAARDESDEATTDAKLDELARETEAVDGYRDPRTREG